MALTMAAPQNAGWRAVAARGFADLSPPEAEHAILELPTNRAEYVGVLQDIGDYPARSPIGHRVPGEDEVANLKRSRGLWRAVVLLEDRGALLYAAWHDPLVKDEHSRRLAEQTGLLVRAAPLLNAATAILTPDHLPGSWNPKPGWRKPRSTEDRRQLAGWSMRSSLVLLYWADRLGGIVCTSRNDVTAALDVALGPGADSISVDVPEPAPIADAQLARDALKGELSELWADLHLVSRRRDRYCLEDAAFVLSGLADSPPQGALKKTWRLSLGERGIPEPAMLIRRILTAQDPEREPPLPRKRLTRRPLCLVPL